MFSKLKEAIGKATEDQKEPGRKTSADLSFIGAKEVEEYRKVLGEVAENIDEIN